MIRLKVGSDEATARRILKANQKRILDYLAHSDGPVHMNAGAATLMYMGRDQMERLLMGLVRQGKILDHGGKRYSLDKGEITTMGGVRAQG